MSEQQCDFMVLVSNRVLLLRANMNILMMNLFHKRLRRKFAETTLAELSQERNIQRESYCPSSLVLRRLMHDLLWIVVLLLLLGELHVISRYLQRQCEGL